MDHEDKGYVCTLTPASLKKAKKELNENPEDRLAAIKALRDWIKQQPHIHYNRLDTETMLIFLRSAKFSQIRARELVEGNLSMMKLAPEWFSNVDPRDSKLQELFDSGYVIPLPKQTKDGCGILLYRLAKMKPSRNHLEIMMKTSMVMSIYTSKNENIQVNGNIFLFDFTGITSGHMSAYMNRKDLAKFHKMWQKNVPGRFKGFLYYNAGAFFEALMTVAKPFLPKKYQERIKVHDTAESLYKEIPMDLLPEEYLPDDYTGPNVGSVDDLIKKFKTEILTDEFVKEVREKSNELNSVDMSLKPSGKINEHFRKLTVD